MAHIGGLNRELSIYNSQENQLNMERSAPEFVRIGQSAHSGKSFENLYSESQVLNDFGHSPDNLLNYCERFETLSIGMQEESLHDDEDCKDVKRTALSIMRLLNNTLFELQIPPFEIRDPFSSETTVDADNYFTHLLNGLGVELGVQVKKPLITLLKKYLIKNFSQLNSKENRSIIENLIAKPVIQKLTIHHSEEEELINHFTILWIYREKLIEMIKPDRELSVKIMRILFDKKVNDPTAAKDGIGKLIEHAYMKALNQNLLSKMHHMIEKQEKEAKTAFFYTNFKNKIADTIHNSNISNILTEFIREVLGGYVAFKTEGVFTVPPFASRENEDVEEEQGRILEWVTKAEQWAGLNIFDDKDLVTRVSTAISLVASVKSSHSSSVSGLEAHAENFESLMSLWDDRKEKTTIIRKLEKELKTNPIVQQKDKEKKQVSTELVVEYILELHRLGTQTILLSAMDVILSRHATLFSKLHKSTITQTIQSKEETDSKFIVLDKVGQTLEVTLTYVRSFKRYSTGQLIQKIIYKRPLPGQKEIADPISVHFFYKRPDIIDEEEATAFGHYVSELSFLIKSLGFPDFQESLDSIQVNK